MKVLFTFFLFTLSAFLYSQEKIEVNYSYKNKFDTSKIEDSSLLNLYKNSNDKIYYYRLLIDGNEAVFEDIEKVDNSQEKDKPAISGPTGRTYINLETRESLAEVEYAGKFIIKDSIDVVEWTISRDRGTHLGYETRKAIYKNDYFSYEAWFIPSIPLKFGPQGYGNLPGLIVKFTHYFNNQYGSHQRSYIADNIALNAKINVGKPTIGKIISQKAFNKIVDDQNNKFRAVENNKVQMKID